MERADAADRDGSLARSQGRSWLPLASAGLLLCGAAVVTIPLLRSPTDEPAPGETPTRALEVETTVESGPPVPEGVDVLVRTDRAGTRIDQRLLGTNVPAWLGPERLASNWFRESLLASGATTIRMPGGSWSSVYGWSDCELRSGSGCIWDGAARPSDYLELLEATGLDGMWTVSINETAQSAAAVVAFFNGSIDDDRSIGVDRNGRDWGTVGDWAAVRGEGGHPDPSPIRLWEIGNEVWGGQRSTGGDQCASYGWEVVWTCDGTEYVTGTDHHDGYLAIRSAMRTVDPDIEIGLVGVPDPSSWKDWGTEVLTAAEGQFEFYVVHQYGFDWSPSPDEAIRRAAELWPDVVVRSRASLPPGTPIALTEYNLVSTEEDDDRQTLTQVANAIFVAETIGELAGRGVEIANHWNFANERSSNGTDYGLVDADTGDPYPAYHAFAAWGRAGDELLDAAFAEDLDDAASVRVYPTRRADGSLHVIVVHTGDASRQLAIGLESGVPTAPVAVGYSAERPDAVSLQERSLEAPVVGGAVEVELGPWSITEIELVPAMGAPNV